MPCPNGLESTFSQAGPAGGRCFAHLCLDEPGHDAVDGKKADGEKQGVATCRDEIYDLAPIRGRYFRACLYLTDLGPWAEVC